MSNFVVTANDINDSADLGTAVDVVVEFALSCEKLEAADRNVFANLADKSFTNSFYCRTVERGVQTRQPNQPA